MHRLRGPFLENVLRKSSTARRHMFLMKTRHSMELIELRVLNRSLIVMQPA
jgi:hypothetical protein